MFQTNLNIRRCFQTKSFIFAYIIGITPSGRKFDGWPKKNNRVPLLYYIKLCVSLQIHLWIQTGVTVRKRSIRDKSASFCPVWPWNLMGDLGKTIGCIFVVVSSYVHHFVAIGEFKLQFVIFCPVWPWNFRHDLENNGATLLCYFKL